MADPAFLGAWFFMTLAPSSSLVPIATEVGAERRMYLPLMALTTASSWVSMVSAVYGHARREPGRDLCSGCGGRPRTGDDGTQRRTSVLADARGEDARAMAERRAHAAVGGELSRLGRDEEALPYLHIGARSDARAQYNLGVTLYNLKRYDESIRDARTSDRRAPDAGGGAVGETRHGAGIRPPAKWAEAIAQLRLTLGMTPNDAEARRLLVDAYSSYGVELAQAGNSTLRSPALRSAIEL